MTSFFNRWLICSTWIVSALSIWMLPGCASQPSNDPDHSLLHATDAYDLAIQSRIRIIDIRPEKERIQNGSPDNSESVPFDREKPDAFVLAISRVTHGNFELPLALICRESVNSTLAQSILTKAGHTATYGIEGGFSGNQIDPGWKGWGLPLN